MLLTSKFTAQFCTYREGKVTKHVENPVTKNEFLADLNKIDSGKMEPKVCSYNKTYYELH